jgi:hypothetical protein
MSVQGLENPLQRLSVLPTTVSWRGTWVNTETYFKNDVAVSAVDGNSYILTGTTSVNAGSSDPSASADWSQFSNTSASSSGLSVIRTPVGATIGQLRNTPAVVTSGSFGLNSSLATPGATYLISWSGTWSQASTFTNTDALRLLFSANGPVADQLYVDIVPGFLTRGYSFAGSVILSIPPLGNAITGQLFTGSTDLSDPSVLNNLIITYTRLSAPIPS